MCCVNVNVSTTVRKTYFLRKPLRIFNVKPLRTKIRKCECGLKDFFFNREICIHNGRTGDIGRNREAPDQIGRVGRFVTEEHINLSPRLRMRFNLAPQVGVPCV